jgi:DNA-binding Xre family transcriptional regulator
MNRLSQMTGLSYVTIWRLSKSDQSRIDLNVLARICDALKAQPGDMLVNVKERKKGDENKSHLPQRKH